MTEQTNAIESSVNRETTTLPLWFWGISIVALLWFLMDASMFVMRTTITEEAINAMPENQQGMFRMPTWVNAVFALEVFGGLLGSVGLLLRKKWALPMFIISIVGVLAQTCYIWFVSDAIDVMGSMAIVMPLVAIVIGVTMIVLTKSAITNHRLR